MTLATSETEISGPADYDAVLPFPVSKEQFYREVLVLAFPNAKQVPGYEFVFELPVEKRGEIDRVVLYNTNSEEPEKYGPTTRTQFSSPLLPLHPRMTSMALRNAIL